MDPFTDSQYYDSLSPEVILCQHAIVPKKLSICSPVTTR